MKNAEIKEYVKKWMETHEPDTFILNKHKQYIYKSECGVSGLNLVCFFEDLLGDFINESKNKVEPSERYFVVAYAATNSKGHVAGFIDITTNGEYLNRALTIESITEKLNVTDVVPTNIIEMNKVDFDSWSN